MNSKGQALMETCLTLPVIFALFNGLVFFIYFSLAFFLTDYWVYQTNICLASHEPKVICRNELKSRLQKLPLVEFSIYRITRSTYRTQVNVLIHKPFEINVSDSLRIPLKSNDFKRF